MRSYRRRLTVCLLAFILVLAAPALAQEDALIQVSESDTLGPYLTDAEGMTLYTFDRDALGVSNCYEQCAENWPALTVESADAATAAEGVPGVLGTAERTDGTLQVTYNGLPLYYWARDEAPGDTTGHRVGRVWWVATPATFSIGGNEELGRFLVGPTGMTLYKFDNDVPGSGESACYEQCAENWPALTVESADDVLAGVNLPGEAGTIERTDGTLQVTYNGSPLYYWYEDEAIGDTNGQGVGDVWWVVKPEVVALGSTDALGDFLTTADGRTLYTFANDEPGVSNCTGDCLEAWPAFTVPSEEALVAVAGLEGEWGVIAGDEGAPLHVTYNGMPLYLYAEDFLPGDTFGQGLGDVWFVAAP